MQTNIKNKSIQTTSPGMQNIYGKLPIDSPCSNYKPSEQPIRSKLSVKKAQSNNQPHTVTYANMAVIQPPPQPLPQQKPVNAEDALKMTFPVPWNIWIHKNSSKDWSLAGYDKIMTIQNVGDLWSFINSFNKVNYMDYQFFVMRGDIIPIWEAPENRNGGAASIRMKLSDKNLLRVWEEVCLYAINDQICPSPKDVNGVSFNLKNDLTVIKIWNKDGNHDISRKISRNITNKYKLYSIVYIKNRPEY